MHFGQIDLIEIALAAILLTQRARLASALRALARRPLWCAALLFIFVVALRLALLPLHPVPTGAGADDFSYLLLGDTLAHFRLANPVHPMHEFFETNFVLQRPTYSSIYPAGQGIVLAFGQLLLHQPWAGVLVSMALLAALCYWMLLGWVSPPWALAGGALALFEFGPLNSWMNCYWGGAVSAIAGCLVFGSLPRIGKGRAYPAVLLGFGIGLQMLARPYESLFLDAAVAIFFIWGRRRIRPALPALAGLAPMLLLLLAQNHAVTGSWLTLPYSAGRYQYGIPTTFTFQPLPVPHNTLTAAQELYYEGQSAAHGSGETAGRYLSRLFSRAPFYLFFLEVPLLLAVPFFLLNWRRDFRVKWIVCTAALFALGCNFYPYFFPQYIAAETPLFLLAALIGLQRLTQWKRAGRVAAAFILLLCAAHFLFWYSVHALGDRKTLMTLVPQESDSGINFGDPEGRIAINRRLAAAPGKQLVFVRYFSSHAYHEWIHNAADIDSSRVVYALELTPGENQQLERYYPDRKVWLLEPDADPPKLLPYPKTNGPFLTVE